jgi:predicted lipoprotein with Yx(FWY)xxD motif
VVSRRLLGVAVAIVAALAFAACGDDSGSSSASTAAAGTTAAATATTAAGGAATTAAAAGGAATTAAGAAAGSATVIAATNATIGQSILENSAGMTIYLFEPDGTATTSAVPAGIKANWPAVVATGTPVAGPGLDASKLTVVPQPDGTQQVAYNGHLLYTFISDVAPGDAKGQDLGGVWYVVTPTGDKYEAS